MSLQPISENRKKLNLVPTLANLCSNHGSNHVPTLDMIDLTHTNKKTTTWLTIKETSELLGISSRAIRKKAKQGKYIAQMIDGNGGKQYRILLDDTLQEAIDKFNKDVTTDGPEMGANSTVLQGEVPQPCTPAFLDSQNDKTLVEIPIQRGLVPTNPAFSYEEVIPTEAKTIAMARYDVVQIWKNFRDRNYSFNRDSGSNKHYSCNRTYASNRNYTAVF